ncbi:hypothetical protein PPYR_00416 [Photinus pyralis]|uniref:Uncharacterized protein n=1 Tax=Photinus pyralis TaxID=7054 RepID=A0A5N4B1K9_PHOPY|nr:hypothetical protein PPYR_00416 [Photinus pyralis]
MYQAKGYFSVFSSNMFLLYELPSLTELNCGGILCQSLRMVCKGLPPHPKTLLTKASSSWFFDHCVHCYHVSTHCLLIQM